MEKANGQQPETPSKQDNQKESECPSCGGRMTKATFRTGKMGHTPEPTNACKKCGTRT